MIKNLAPLVNGYLAVMLLTSTVTAQIGDTHSAAEDLMTIDGLLDRSLYSLSARLCERRLANSTESIRAQSDFTRARIRIHAGQARSLPAVDRDDHWQAIAALATDFARQHHNHTQSLLVDFQVALAELSRATLTHDEFSVSSDPNRSDMSSLGVLRQAVQRLEALEERTAEAIRIAHRELDDGQRLTEDELTLLRGQVRLRLGTAYRLQALCYPEGSPDRLLACASALGHLQKLSPAQLTTQLWWESQLMHVECLRLKQDWASADQALARLSPLTDDVAAEQSLLAERIRLDLARDRMDDALLAIAKGRERDGQVSSELDLAHLEAYATAWEQAKESGDERTASSWKQTAMNLLKTIEETHPEDISRRAARLTINRLGTAGLSGDIQALHRVAADHYHHGRIDEAVATYLEAAELASKRSFPQLDFTMSYQAGVIQHQQQRLEEAAAIFRTIASRYPQHPRAPQTHLLAIGDYVQLARSSPSALETYEQMLHEHLNQWPADVTSNQVRWWLGRLLDQREEWADAATLYMSITEPGTGRVKALKQAHWSFVQSFERQRDAGKLDRAEVQQAVDQFQAAFDQYNDDQRGQVLPAAVIALYAMIYLEADMQGVVQPAHVNAFRRSLDSWPVDLQDLEAEAKSLLVLALATQRDWPEAKAALRDMGSLSPQSALQLAKRIRRQARLPIDVENARLQLAVIEAETLPNDNVAADVASQRERFRAEALVAAGESSRAISDFTSLAEQYPNDAEVQETYARLLLQSSDPAHKRKSLEQWRLILSRSRPQSERWFTAKYSIAQAHFDLGERDQAEQIIRLQKALYPDLGGEELRRQFDRLLLQCERP
ncbi:MAG: hypothetical protein KDA60_03675 [Planctomycetales bacterium]|nr:hypothetical protein [Planctomycetales bacterium]